MPEPLEPRASPSQERPCTVYNRGMSPVAPSPLIELRLGRSSWNCTGCPWPDTTASASARSRTAWPWVGRLWPRRLACMPTPLSLENAIATVEDAVMPASRWLAKPLQAPPAVHPAHAQPIAARGGRGCRRDAVHTTRRLSRQAVENLFNRLSDQIHRPGATDTALPQRAEWAAALLILREGLHHWGVEWVELG